MNYLLNGQSININKPYTTPSGVKYPHLKDAAIRQQLGVVEAQPEPEFNPQFYLDADTPRPLQDLKDNWTRSFKSIANSHLRETDWVVVRKAERGVDIPQIIADERASILAEADRLEAAIAACADVEALIAVVSSQEWPNDKV
jgi:hypothetical protein